MLTDRLVPVGIDGRRELRWVCAGLCLGLLYSLGFLLRLRNAYRSLFDFSIGSRPLRFGAIMPDFAEIFAGTLTGFWIVAVCMLALLGFHYVYHFQGSKSIYLMRRLPARWELLRRCVLLPLLTAAAIAALTAALLFLYYTIYMSVTPTSCLTPNQWAKFWMYHHGGI